MGPGEASERAGRRPGEEVKGRTQRGSDGFMEGNTSSPLATCPPKNRSIARDSWKDASDPELRVQGRILQLDVLQVKGE